MVGKSGWYTVWVLWFLLVIRDSSDTEVVGEETNESMKTSLLLIPGLLAAAAGCSASSIVYVTPPGSTVSGGPVSSSATFTPGNGTLTIEIDDLFANPTSAGQLVSDLQFNLRTADITATLTSSSAQEITIAGGVGSVGPTVSTGWGFGSYQSGYIVCVICPGGLSQPPTAQPSETIIGPGPYTNANGSINNNGPHNPFLNQSATFTITAPGITDSTTVSDVVFSFGTPFGNTVPGIPTPEPGTTALIGAGLVAVFLVRRSPAARVSARR
jgi:hypothetical protein